MDTINASPKQTSASKFLGVALSLATGLWLVAMTTEMASAQTASSPQANETVAYGDLDLSTADGARTLLRRINVAAHRICGPEPVHSQLQPRLVSYYRDCVADSVDIAVARIGSPALLALHKGTQSPSSAALAAR